MAGDFFILRFQCGIKIRYKQRATDLNLNHGPGGYMTRLLKYAALAASCGLTLAVITLGTASANGLPINKGQPQIKAVESLNWTGWYAGLFSGYGWGESNPSISSVTGDLRRRHEDYLNRYIGAAGPDLRLDGAVLGLQAGYDLQIQPSIVVGVVGDFAWSGIHGTASLAGLQMTRDMKWIGSLDARAGYLITPQTLAYLIGGLSVAKFNTDIRNIGWGGEGYGPSFSDASSSDTKWGWNIGGGLESKIGRNWSVFGDARYFKFPDTTTSLPGEWCRDSFAVGVTNKNEFAIARVGINFRPQN
jgi:outer membrane immunogenic protein